MKEKLLGIAQAVLTALLIVSGAIALPILFRPFYYWHIKPLHLTDWIFDSRFDPIINMLPEEFFRNCALLILFAILLSCGVLILWDIHKRKNALPVTGSAFFRTIKPYLPFSFE
ncbi:MAG: hypothetical protein IKJ16_06135 [Agathobacter sp.]|nr:hypothetical protein [Agathobacter sp.]